MGLKHCRDFPCDSVYTGISDGFQRAYKYKCHWNSVEVSENINHLSVSHFTVSLEKKKKKKRETEKPSHLMICAWLL